MKRVIVTSLVLSLTLSAGWTRTYGGPYTDEAYDVIKNSDGSYTVLGFTESLHGYSSGLSVIDTNIWLLKLNSEGDTLWTRKYGGDRIDIGYMFEQTTDGGYIIAGLKDGNGYDTSDVWILKTDSLGDTLWTRTYGGNGYDEARYIHQTSDGGYMVMGRTKSFGAGELDIWLLRTDSLGDTLWTRTYGGSRNDYFCSAEYVLADDGYIILADWYSDFYEYSLLRIDQNGDSLWMKTEYDDYPGWKLFDACYIIQSVPDAPSGFVMVGCDKGGPYNFPDVWIALTDFFGDSIWIRTYGGEEMDEAYCVIPTSDMGLAVAGYTVSFGKNGAADVWLLRTNDADTAWTRTYGGNGADVGKSVIETADKGFLIAGWTEPYENGNRDIFLVKTDSLGNVGISEPSSETPAPSSPVTHFEIASPIGSEIVLSYSLSQDEPGSLKLFDASGRMVESLVVSGGGEVKVAALSAGVYFCRLEAGGVGVTRKVVVVK